MSLVGDIVSGAMLAKYPLVCGLSCPWLLAVPHQLHTGNRKTASTVSPCAGTDKPAFASR